MFNRALFTSLLIVGFCTTFTSKANAQYSALIGQLANPYYYFIQIHKEAQTVEAKPTKTVVDDKKPTPYIRKTKRISAAYDSYAIVIKESNRPLLSTDPIFKQFGSIVYDKTESGSYVYLIKTPFKSKKNVESFMEVVLEPRIPEVYMIAYKDGTIKK